MEAGAGVWEQWWPHPPHTSQQWCLVFQADQDSSRGIPSHTSPHSCPLCCICTANSVPLPGSILPTLHFSTQPHPTPPPQHQWSLVPGSCAQGWFPRRLWDGWCSGPWSPHRWRTPQTEGRVSRLRCEPLPVPMEAKEGSWRLGKVALSLACHWTMMSCFYGISDFFHRLSWLWSSLLLSLQAVFSQPTAVPSLGSCSKPHFPEPSPVSQQATHDSGWNAQSYSVDHACSSYFVLPSTDHLLHSPLIPWKSFSVPADFPTVREFFWVWGPPLIFSFLPVLLSFYDSSFLFSFILLGVWSLPLMFSKCSVGTVPFVDEFLMYLWEVTNSTSSYSIIWTPPH